MEAKRPIFVSVMIAIGLELIKPLCPIIDTMLLTYWEKHSVIINTLAAICVLIGIAIGIKNKLQKNHRELHKSHFVRKYGKFIEKDNLLWANTYPPIPHCKNCIKPLYFVKKKHNNKAKCECGAEYFLPSSIRYHSIASYKKIIV